MIDNEINNTEDQNQELGIVTSRPTYGGDGRTAPRGKLHCYNWLEDIPGGFADFDIVEVQFKNTRKGYYRNSNHIPLEKGGLRYRHSINILEILHIAAIILNHLKILLI